MKIEEALQKFLGEKCRIVTTFASTLESNIIEGTIKEVGEGWIRFEESGKESIVNLTNVIRVCEIHGGKKKQKDE